MVTQACEDDSNVVLEAQGLSMAYGPVMALENVDAAFRKGTCTGIIGPNGAGKSTLLQVLAGLLDGYSGQVMWNGRLRRGFDSSFAYLPQAAQVDWNFPVSVGDVVQMGSYPKLNWWRKFTQSDREAVDAAMERMHISRLSDRLIRELSGGEKQRTFLARALVQQAQIFLLDEPFAGLDFPSQEQLGKVLRELVADGRILICSYHELATVQGVFDQVVFLNRRVVASGAVGTVMTADNIEATYGHIMPLVGQAAPSGNQESI